MTMRIRRSDTIAGVPAFAARNFFRWACQSFSFGVRAVRIAFGCDHGRALDIIRQFLAEGLIEKDERPDEYTTTKSGSRVAASTATPPITRKTANSNIQMLIERAHQISVSDDFIDKVESMWVFGSYVRLAETLGDLDVFVMIKPKDPQRTDHAEHLHGRRTHPQPFSNYVDQLQWHRTQVYRYLRNRKHSISIIAHEESMPTEADCVELWPNDRRTERGLI